MSVLKILKQKNIFFSYKISKTWICKFSRTQTLVHKFVIRGILHFFRDFRMGGGGGRNIFIKGRISSEWRDNIFYPPKTYRSGGGGVNPPTLVDSLCYICILIFVYVGTLIVILNLFVLSYPLWNRLCPNLIFC